MHMSIGSAYFSGNEDKKILAGFMARPVFRAEDTEGEALSYEQIELPEPSSYSPVVVPIEDTTDKIEDSNDDEAMLSPPDYQLQIVSPEDDKTIRANDGNLTVNIQIRPALSQKRGDMIQLRMDDRPYGLPNAGLSFNLANIDRGTHTLSAVVMNAKGEELAQSAVIKFHLQRNSVLLNPRTRINPP